MTFLVQFAQKALILRGRDVLLIQKSPDDVHNPLRWEVPGGRLEQGESVDEQLRREVLEEVGLLVDVGAPLAIWSWQLGKTSDAPTVVAVLRRCAPTNDRPTSSNQGETDFIQAWKWVPIDDVADYDLIPNARAAILSGLEAVSESSGRSEASS